MKEGKEGGESKERKEEKKKGRETRNHKADIPIPSADAAGLYHIVYLYDYSVFRKYHGISELSADYGIFKVQMGGACQFQAHAAAARYGQNIPELVHHRGGETGAHDGACLLSTSDAADAVGRGSLQGSWNDL